MEKRGESGYTCRMFTEGDEPALVQLTKSTFPNFLKGDYWVWKYKLNPDFDPSLVAVAENGGEVVGCNHWLVRNLKLSSSLKVKAVLGADIIVHPGHRGRGIGTQLLQFLRLSGAFRKKGIILSYMFALPELSKHLYEPVAGYVAAPNYTTTYTKFLNCRVLEENFERINELIKSRKELQKKLEGSRMRVSFRLKGAPAFSINIESEGFYLEKGERENPDVVVEGNWLFFSKISVWDLAKSLVTGKVKIRGGVVKGFKLLKALRVFQRARALVRIGGF